MTPGPRRLVLATRNPGKVVELRAILAPHVGGVDVVAAGDLGLPDVPETGVTFADNALLKARAVAAATGEIAVADDSGLAVDVLGGAPGGFSARWAGRHERGRHVPEVIRRLVAEHDYQLKFVVDLVEDCREVEEYLAAFAQIDRSRAMLMPQGTDAAALAEKARCLEPYCKEHGLGYCPRRQIEWFGHRRGT